MHATYKNALMWTLYGVLFLLIAVLQTVVFGRARFFGVKLTLIPVCLACVAMLAGARGRGALRPLLRRRLVLYGRKRRRDAHCAADYLRRGDRLSLRPVSGAAAAVRRSDEPAGTRILPDDFIPASMLSRHGPHRHDCCSADSDWPESALVPASVSWSLGRSERLVPNKCSEFPASA